MSTVLQWLQSVRPIAREVEQYALIECLDVSNHREGAGSPSMWVHLHTGHATCFTCQKQFTPDTLTRALRKIAPDKVPEERFASMEVETITLEDVPDTHVPVLNPEALNLLFDSILVYRNLEGEATHLLLKNDKQRMQFAFHSNGQWLGGFGYYPSELFQIELVTQREKATELPKILVLESEFDAMSAQQIFQDTESNAVAVSWCGMVDEFYHCSFDAIEGYDVVLWPNSDSKPIFKGIAERLAPVARRLWVLDHHAVSFTECVREGLDPCAYIADHAVAFDTEKAKEMRSPEDDATED